MRRDSIYRNAAIAIMTALVAVGCGGGNSAITSLNVNNLEDGYEVIIENTAHTEMRYTFCADGYILADMHAVMVVPGTYAIRGNRYIDLDAGNDGTVDVFMDVLTDTMEVGEVYDIVIPPAHVMDKQEIISITAKSCP